MLSSEKNPKPVTPSGLFVTGDLILTLFQFPSICIGKDFSH
jgi:hypothetical protein